MPEPLAAPAVLIGAVFLVAIVYASVGHGGASGYIAALVLCSVPPRDAATSALLLNILVAGLAWLTFWKAGHFSWPLLWPFALGSVPAAFAGGKFHAPQTALYILLALALACAAGVMVLPRPREEPPTDRPPGILPRLGIGTLLGFVSGIVGVGGGIFLTPLIVLCRWAPLRRVAGVSAAFIVINSIAGLAGRGVAGIRQTALMGPLIAAAFLGGVLGAWMGARKLTPAWLRRLLAVVLLIAAGKMILQAARR